jgi:hypothetical protein
MDRCPMWIASRSASSSAFFDPGVRGDVSRPRAGPGGGASLERARAEGLLDRPPDLVQIDADAPERVRILVGEGRSVSIEPVYVLTHLSLTDPDRLERPSSRRVPCAQDAQQDVLRPDVRTAELTCLLLGERDDQSRLHGEALEHRYVLRARIRPRACFLCTAWRLTPSSSAMSCHDHPRPRAFRTWSASSCSTSLRSAATERSPILGS